MPQNQLFQKIFNKNLNDEGCLEFIQDIKNEYPYFSPAHYFLLKKTEENSEGFEKIAATTTLHFTSPFQLNHLLHQKDDFMYAVPGNFQESSLLTDEEIVPLEEEKPADLQEEVNSNSPAIVEMTEAIPPTEPEPAAITETENKEEPVEKAEAPKEEMLFEPLYTTDYFASQGIKLSEEVQPADKLGKQLKSFTDWLKTMKKVHQAPLSESPTATDIAVQKMAEKSNIEDEIITEAMAEAYLQQGKVSKALETYSKLSLLNPAKSAFFAAKIEQLKEK